MQQNSKEEGKQKGENADLKKDSAVQRKWVDSATSNWHFEFMMLKKLFESLTKQFLNVHGTRITAHKLI
jgi:hypothetical protein